MLSQGSAVVLGVELADGVDTFEFMNKLEVVILATHVGDTRTLALPAAQTIYYEMGPALRAQMGIADGLVRVSVGIEDEADLIGDFAQALDACRSVWDWIIQGFGFYRITFFLTSRDLSRFWFN